MAMVLFGLLIGCVTARAQEKQTNQPNLSADEQKLVGSIMAAKDAAAKLTAAGELIKKHPKTSVRQRVAENMANQVANVQDNTQKLTLAQQLETIFNDPAEIDIIGPVVVQAYADANQPDQAFAKGAEFLSHAPDALTLSVQLAAIGGDLTKKQNGKFIPQSIQHTTHAIELIEGDKKPAHVDDARWKEYKERTLPQLYQTRGLLNFAKGNRTEAKADYTKASQINPAEAFNFIMLAAILNEEYQAEGKQYQSMAAGPARDAQLKKVQGLIDGVIDAYAHAVALSEGNAALQQIRQQYVQDLESYYKYRHNGSTEGMQQLIDKYKAPAKP
jgi:tetratricopeptide (TPR) repeat protein